MFICRLQLVMRTVLPAARLKDRENAIRLAWSVTRLTLRTMNVTVCSFFYVFIITWHLWLFYFTPFMNSSYAISLMKPLHQRSRHTSQHWTTEVELCDDKWANQRQQGGVLRQWTPHTTYLPQCSETGSDSRGDVSRHGDVSIDVDPEVADGRLRQNSRVSNRYLSGRDLMSTASWRTPEYLGLGGVELQPIGHH